MRYIYKEQQGQETWFVGVLGSTVQADHMVIISRSRGLPRTRWLGNPHMRSSAILTDFSEVENILSTVGSTISARLCSRYSVTLNPDRARQVLLC